MLTMLGDHHPQHAQGVCLVRHDVPGLRIRRRLALLKYSAASNDNGLVLLTCAETGA